MKKLLLILPVAILVLVSSFIYKPKPAEGAEIKWMTWDEVQQAQKKEKRKIFVDVYTDWCGWCKRMDASTFKHPDIVKYVGDNYYAVKFDAETHETIKYNGKEYKWVNSGRNGYNELAAELLGGQLSFPTTVYIDEELNEIFPVPGYLDPQRFEMVLNYVGSNSYKSMRWEDFDAKFTGKIPKQQ